MCQAFGTYCRGRLCALRGLKGSSLRCCLSPLLQKGVVFTLSTTSCQPCPSCPSITALVLSGRSRVLLSPCTDTDVAFASVSRECPFDPTCVCNSTLSLWAFSFLLSSMEIVFGICCLLLTLHLLCLCHCCYGMHRREVSLQAAPGQSPNPGQCLGLLRLQCGSCLALSNPMAVPCQPCLLQCLHSPTAGPHRSSTQLLSGCVLSMPPPKTQEPIPMALARLGLHQGSNWGGSRCFRDAHSPLMPLSHHSLH
ncbi:transmembrane protein 54 [Lathamus discolor]|uniref:transmembrane protein 54 n=1 Tax=Lathamus discolor TaxID=678569 RepID=UPI0032B79F67